LERSDNPGDIISIEINPERVRQPPNPFRVVRNSRLRIPGFSLRSNPGLELANAFGVNLGLEIANAFGVNLGLEIANAFGVNPWA
jgi:predicted outer membrane lipoprotein